MLVLVDNNDDDDQHHIGAFGELVGLSVPQLRRYDRLGLLEPDGRTEAGYRYYSSGQTGAGRAIALLRSMDMPIAEIRELLTGTDDERRQQLFRNHRARLEETRRLLDAVDSHTKENPMGTATTDLSAWLHVMPRLLVTDIDRSLRFYEEVLGLRASWRTTDNGLAAVASGEIEIFLLIPWSGDGAPPSQSAYIYVEDPDALCAEYARAGATIVEPVDSRPSGMRDFTLLDPDGHRFTLGRGEERLRDVADYYGMNADEIAVNPSWLHDRH